MKSKVNGKEEDKEREFENTPPLLRYTSIKLNVNILPEPIATGNEEECVCFVSY